jgi:hypothetical protein
MEIGCPEAFIGGGPPLNRLREESHQKAEETQDDRLKKTLFFSQKQPDPQKFKQESRQKKESAPVFHDPFSSGNGPYFSFKYNG